MGDFMETNLSLLAAVALANCEAYSTPTSPTPEGEYSSRESVASQLPSSSFEGRFVPYTSQGSGFAKLEARLTPR